MSYCSKMGDDNKCNDILSWSMIECLYCKNVQPLRNYHILYRVPVISNGIKQEGRFELQCLKCDQIMILKSFNLEKLKP